MHVSSITVIVTVAALFSAPGWAASANPAGGSDLSRPDDFSVRARQVSCIDHTTGLPIASLARSVRCANPVGSTNLSSCIDPATGLPMIQSAATAPVDPKTRRTSLTTRAALKARGGNLAKLTAGAGRTACLNPASKLSISPLTSSARAGVAAAGGNGFLGAGALFGVLGLTASTVGGVAALATGGGSASPVSP